MWVILNNHNEAFISPRLDAPAPSPAVSNGGRYVPDSNESPAVSNPALAHSALDLFSSLPAPSSASSTKTTVTHYTVCSPQKPYVLTRRAAGLSVGLFVGPPLWSRRKYLNKSWGDWDFNGPKSMNSTDVDDLLTFLWCHHDIDICG